MGGGKRKINLEKFLIFNQQFVTLVRAGLPILKALDLLSERLTDAKLAPHIKAVREEVKNGALLSDAFAKPGRVSAHLRHQRTGGREKRRAGRSARPLHYLSEAGAGGAEKTAAVAGVSGAADRAGDRPDGFSGHLRGAEVRRTVPQHVGAIARRHADPDCGRNHGAQATSCSASSAWCSRHRVPILGENRQGRRERGPLEAAHAAGGRNLDQIPGGAVRARAEHAAGRRHPAAAGASKPRPTRWERGC